MRTRERVAHGSPLFMPLRVRIHKPWQDNSPFGHHAANGEFCKAAFFPVLLRTLFTVTILLYTVKFHIVNNRDYFTHFGNSIQGMTGLFPCSADEISAHFTDF